MNGILRLAVNAALMIALTRAVGDMILHILAKVVAVEEPEEYSLCEAIVRLAVMYSVLGVGIVWIIAIVKFFLGYGGV